MVALNSLVDEFGDKFYQYRTLLLNTGGYSQRQPNGAMLGKIFTLLPAPITDDARTPKSVLSSG